MIEVGHNFVNQKFGENFIGRIGGYPIFTKEGQLIIYGIRKTVFSDISEMTIIYKPRIGSTLEFLKEDYIIEDEKIYHCVCLPFHSDFSNDPLLKYWIFENVEDAFEFFSLVSDFFNQQLEFYKREEIK